MAGCVQIRLGGVLKRCRVKSETPPGTEPTGLLKQHAMQVRVELGLLYTVGDLIVQPKLKECAMRSSDLAKIIDLMLSAGCTHDQVKAVCAGVTGDDEARREKQRERWKETKRKQRMSTNVQVGHDKTVMDTVDTLDPSPSSNGFPPPVYSNNKYPPSLTPPSSVRASTRGTRLPNDWAPTDEDRMFAADLLPFWETEIDKFRDYWLAKTGANATKKDWSATWRNWCRNAHERSRPPRKADAAPNLMEIYAARARESERREREEATVLAFGRK